MQIAIAVIGLGLPVVLVAVAAVVWTVRRLSNRPADSFMVYRGPMQPGELLDHMMERDSRW